MRFMLCPYPTTNGAFAECVSVKSSQVALKLRSIDHLNSAAIPLAGLTAWQGLSMRLPAKSEALPFSLLNGRRLCDLVRPL